MEAIEIFQALRRNDATVTAVRSHFPFRSPFSLAAALDGNMHVRNLELDWTRKTPSGFGDFFISCDGDETDMTDYSIEHGRLIAYIKQAESLRSVRFFFYRKGRNIGDWIDAVAGNSNIVDFEVTSWESRFADFSTVPAAVAGLLQATQSIKSMEIGLHSRGEDACDALRTNSTLESLAVSDVPAGTMVSVLNAVRGHGSIRCLTFALEYSDAYTTPLAVTEAVSSVLRSSTLLTELFLRGIAFDDEGVEQVTSGLNVSCSMTKLVLKSCRFTIEAKNSFISYMQGRNGRDGESGLQCLQMANCGATSPEDPQGVKFLAQIVQSPRSSGLTSVTFELPAVFDFMSATELQRGRDSTRSQRRRDRTRSPWRPDDARYANLDPVVRKVPYVLCLRSLELRVPNEIRDSRRLLDAIRANGSLYDVVARHRRNDGTGEQAPWSPNEERLVKAWGERNRHLPELLKKCGTKSSDENSIGKEQVGGSSDGNGPPPPPSFVGPSLSSKLFAVALQTPRMALHHCFHGITAMGDSIEYDHGSRIREDEATTDRSYESPKKRACLK